MIATLFQRHSVPHAERLSRKQDGWHHHESGFHHVLAPSKLGLAQQSTIDSRVCPQDRNPRHWHHVHDQSMDLFRH